MLKIELENTETGEIRLLVSARQNTQTDLDEIDSMFEALMTSNIKNEGEGAYTGTNRFVIKLPKL